MHKRICTSQKPVEIGPSSNRKTNTEPYEDDEKASHPDPELEVAVHNSKEVNQQTYFDKLIHGEVTLQRDNMT